MNTGKGNLRWTGKLWMNKETLDEQEIFRWTLDRETLDGSGQGNFRQTLDRKILDEHWTGKLQMDRETSDEQGNFR